MGAYPKTVLDPEPGSIKAVMKSRTLLPCSLADPKMSLAACKVAQLRWGGVACTVLSGNVRGSRCLFQERVLLITEAATSSIFIPRTQVDGLSEQLGSPLDDHTGCALSFTGLYTHLGKGQVTALVLFQRKPMETNGEAVHAVYQRQ